MSMQFVMFVSQVSCSLAFLLKYFSFISLKDDLLDNFGLNIHRIDKDVLRCDRNYPYFTNENLEKLRRIMCT